ncbi:MAG TPA: carboxypeptidase regulatory-like domain-containing protein, partial [Vicinamibacterales bacterium]|nr:carboxypeptidase regulatory-like domain-containing protein [Vicinamibacterales bacterium]
MRRWLRTLFAAICLIVPPATAIAQETVNYASVAGRITDPSGSVVVGAEVAARQAETGTISTTKSDREGRYRFAHLTPGAYEIIVRQAGFKDTTRRLTLNAGAAFDLPFSLPLASVTDAITVDSGYGPIIETARSQISASVAATEIKSVPLNGRNFLDLALLLPGVSPTNVGGGTQLFAETSAVPGVGISVSSQRNLSNNFMVDGLSANDDAAALSGIAYGVDAVDQFQVITSGGQAELGRALGGQVNVTTKSGTNALHVDGYGFFRDDRFNGVSPLLADSPLLQDDPALNHKLPMHQNQLGGSAGGPIVAGRTWYFGNLEDRSLNQSGLTTIGAGNPAVVDQINTRLKAVGYGGPPVQTGIYSNPIDTTHGLAKIDYQFAGGTRVSTRYSFYDVASQNARSAGGLNAPSASAGLDNLDQTLAVNAVRVLGDRAVIEARGQIAFSRLDAPPSDPIGPAVNILGVAAFGTLSNSPTARDNTMTQIVGNLWYEAGTHSVKVGADVLTNDDTITFPRAARGSYTFASLNNFLAGVYNNSGFTQTFGDSVVHQTNPNLGLYLQDEWRVRTGVTINAGLRYDLQFLDTIDTDANNFSPRAGVAWAPAASQRWLVRASAGRFFDRVPLRAVANALLSAGNTTDPSRLRQTSVSLSPNQTGAPAFPNTLPAAVATTALVNFTTIDRGIQNAHSDQASVEVERQLGPLSAISVGYDYLRAGQLIMQINQNVPQCAVAGGNNGCRPNPAFANNNQYSSAGRSNYHGAHVSFVQRPTKWGSYRVSYTYSKSMNNVGEAFFNGPIDPFDLDVDWARSDDDQRHRLAVSGAINSPMAPPTTKREALTHGFQLSWVLQYYSAPPFNITTGTTTIQGTAARPVVGGAFISRNAGVASDFSTISVRVSRIFELSKRVKVEGLIEAFNLFDRRNNLARVTVFGTGAYPEAPVANFNSVTVVGEPRSLQL